ncbi:hypothetical protein LJR277_003306 [Pseudomonas sp. LjRoot277]|uniref:hypothetical protein n=1 Tax=Pseudomonas sp. LjRoot277 TaxID=3342307 RepID=UPI003ECF1C78
MEDRFGQMTPVATGILGRLPSFPTGKKRPKAVGQLNCYDSALVIRTEAKKLDKLVLFPESVTPMTPAEKLLEWNANWTISHGVVSCKTCHAEQSELDRDKAFLHGTGCVRAPLGILPWQALDDVQQTLSIGKKHD